MLVPQAFQDGFVAATNAVRGATLTTDDVVSPIGSFTDPEYAQAGSTEAKARETRDVVVAVVHLDQTTRALIDGRATGFCKLIVDRATRTIVGCHMAARMRVDELSRIPLSFPTYTGILGRAAAVAARQLHLEGDRSSTAELL
jgi:dihydrolipoamide dehydrogenase